jgi:hypothetical protein
MQRGRETQEYTKPTRKDDWAGWLEYGVYCLERSWVADMRSMRYGSSITGDRERATSERWAIKSDDALNRLRAHLRADSV